VLVVFFGEYFAVGVRETPCRQLKVGVEWGGVGEEKEGVLRHAQYRHPENGIRFAWMHRDRWRHPTTAAGTPSRMTCIYCDRRISAPCDSVDHQIKLVRLEI
jgi:hypothetical protein